MWLLGPFERLALSGQSLSQQKHKLTQMVKQVKTEAGFWNPVKH